MKTKLKATSILAPGAFLVNQIRKRHLQSLALALVLGAGLTAESARAQTILEVGGAATIANEILTTANVPASGVNWTAPGGNGSTFSSLISPTATVGATGAVTLTFTHRYNFEQDVDGNWDGGAVFISVNGGSFTKVPLASFTSNGYSGTALASVWTLGEEIFAGQSNDWGLPILITSVATLGSLTAADTVAVEFRGGWDGNTFPASPNWEIGTIQISDTGGTLLSANFALNGKSGFTASTTGNAASPWKYLQPVNRFEIDATTVTADRYAPVTAGSAINLNGANIEVVKLAGTLAAGQVYSLFDLSGNTTLTGTLGSITLPGGTWDTSSLATAGTITCLDPAFPLIYEPFSDLNTTLSGNTPGLGLTGTWSGQSLVAADSLFYGALANQGGRAITNPANNYDVCGISPGSTLTNAGLMADGATLWFSVLIVNRTSPLTADERTYVSIGTGTADGFDRVGGNTGSGFTIAVSKNLEGAVTAQGWNSGSAGTGNAIRGGNFAVTPGATFLAVGKITWGPFGTPESDVFELYLPGTDLALGAPVSTVTANFDQLGTANVGNAFDTISFAGGIPLAGVPEVDEIRFGATYADVTPKDFTAPLIVSTDPVDDSPSGRRTQQVATFNEPVLVGTGNIRIVNETDAVTTTIPVGDSQIVVSGKTLTITPNVPLLGGKAYHIEIDAGAVKNGNNLAFAGISLATEWSFIADGVPPTVESIDDSVSPLPILINSKLTYTVTFSEPIDAATVDTADFANGGSASVTVDSVSATGNPAVFKVVVSTVAPGSLTLQIVASALITDLSGASLITTSAIPDDTTIAVNNPTPTTASLLTDFQATIASEQHPTYAGEARYFHVSVNPTNAGTGSYAATIVGTNNAAPVFVRNYSGPVLSYKFVGGAENIAGTIGVGMSGGNTSLINHTTQDALYDGFGQQQAKVWDATNPGADLATGGTPYTATGDKNAGLFRSLGGAVGTVDISGLASGSVHIYYGSFSAKPSVRVTMRDIDNVAADITLANAHLNNDTADRTEYYLAEIDFVTAGFYDVIEYEWLANGVDYAGNGRGIGTVLTGPAVGYSSWATLNSATANLAGDHDNDGVDNGIEYFLGGPTGPTTGFTVLPGVINTLGTLSITWPKGVGYLGVYDTHFVVETSDTLTGVWTAETLAGGNITDSGTEVKFTFPPPLSGKNFARLKVTGP